MRYAAPQDATTCERAERLRAAFADELLDLEASLPEEERCHDARLIAAALLRGADGWDAQALDSLTDGDLAAFLAQF